MKNKTGKKSISFGGLKNIFVFPISPRKQFARLVILCCILFCGIVAYHVYFFNHIESQGIPDTAPVAEVPQPKINEKKLESVLSRYEDKKAVQEKAGQMNPSVIDPSK